MNNIQKGLLTLMVAGIASASFVGCDEDDTFDINSPEWLSSRIDSIAAAKNSNSSSDTTIIEVSSTTIGTTDNATGWWGAFTDFIAIPSGKRLVMEFDNYSSGANNYNNWVLVTANRKGNSTDVDGYKEYFALRSDAYGWGGAMGTDEGYTYDAANITTNYAEVAAAAGASDQWAYFLEKINGSHVVLEIQHVSAGYIYVTATMTATDGTVLIEEYHQTASASEDIYAYLTVDNCHYENFSAMLLPATIVITESNPARLELANCPAFITLGDTAYYEGVTGKVTFEDGTSTDVTTSDLSFTEPDLTTTGSKTVTAIYNKTSRGNYCAPVYASYTLLVTDFRSIRVEPVEKVVYFFPAGATEVPFITKAATLYGIGSDGEETVLDNSLATFSGVNASGEFTVTYQGLTTTGTVKVDATDCTQIGSDLTTGWWTVFSEPEQVKEGATLTKTLQVRSDNSKNWHGPITLIRTADLKEIAVLREDNFGWGDGVKVDDNNYYATRESDWNFDTFASNIDGSVITVSVTNNGSTVDVKMSVIDASGEAHFQNYIGIITTKTELADADDVYLSFTCEGSYLIIK